MPTRFSRHATFIAIATVSYRHWLEHRGSEGLVAEILQPVEEAVGVPPEASTEAPAPPPPVQHAPVLESDKRGVHPTTDTTPDQMRRARPDLTTGELKMPRMD
jgi:hypothetical protein